MGTLPTSTAGSGHAGLWIAIHVVQLLLILLLAAVYWLTEGLTSTAARCRVALLPYLVFYSAFDAVVGLSNGLVVKYGANCRQPSRPC